MPAPPTTKIHSGTFDLEATDCVLHILSKNSPIFSQDQLRFNECDDDNYEYSLVTFQ